MEIRRAESRTAVGSFEKDQQEEWVNGGRYVDMFQNCMTRTGRVPRVYEDAVSRNEVADAIGFRGPRVKR